MRTRSERWDEAIKESHHIVVEADVLVGDDVVRDTLAVVGGQAVFDRSAAIRGRCSLTLAEPYMLPGSNLDVLGPGGYQIALRRGIRYLDGTTELMPLGVYPIQQSGVGDTLVTSISAMDRSQFVADARLETDYTIAAGVNYATAIQALIADGVPWLTFAFASTTYTTPALVIAAQADRWAEALKMAAAIGYELYFDGLGRCVLRPEPDLSNTEPVWSVAEGPRGALISAGVTRDRQYAYSRWVAVSQNSSVAGPSLVGIATDDDPASPTYYHGPFGHKPKFFVSEFIATQAQADGAAAAMKARDVGIAKAVDLSAVPNPALEPGDVIAVTRERLGLSQEVHVVEQMTIDLSPAGAMPIGTRARQDAA